MDFKKIAKWHWDYNEGYIPILETPDGELADESRSHSVLAVSASDYAPRE